MSSAEQGFYEGLKVLRPIFQDRTHVVGKQISAGLHVTTCGARAISGCRENEVPVEAAITLEVPLDSRAMPASTGPSFSLQPLIARVPQVVT